MSSRTRWPPIRVCGRFTMRLASTFERMGDLPATWPRPLAAPTRPPPRIRPAGVRRDDRLSTTPLTSCGHALRSRCQDRRVPSSRRRQAGNNLHHQTSIPALSDDITRQQTVDIVLLGRFLERLGDTPGPPPGVHRPASTLPRSRPATRAPTSTDWGLSSHWANN